MALHSTLPSELYSFVASILSTTRQFLLRPRFLFSVSYHVHRRANEIARDFEFSDDDAREAVQLFLRQMGEGLQKDGTSLSQLPTFVTALPTGKEEGLYLAVDLGGTNLRVCSVQLAGNNTIILNPPTASEVPIPQEKMESRTASELFVWVAQEISKFLNTYHADDIDARRNGNSYRLGFSFSHAYEQQGINRGILLQWSKAFNIPDAVGKDICALLQAELDNLQLPVIVTALVNDATGTLLARSYETGGQPKTVLGAIFGTGSNGAYVEKIENICKLDMSESSRGRFDLSAKEMIVNTEWAAFDNQMLLLPNTEFDQAADDSSVNPRQELFEKRISGLYLGEILRHVILQLYSIRPRWCTRLPRPMLLDESPLNIPWAIDSSFLSALAIERSIDKSYVDGVVASKLKTYLDEGATYIASKPIQKVSLAIAKRAARLSGVAIAAVVINSGLLNDLDNVLLENFPLNSSFGDVEVQKSLSPTITAILTTKGTTSIFHSIRQLWHQYYSPGSKKASGVTQTTPRPLIDIGVTGSLWQKYPYFETMAREVLREMPGIGPEGEKRIRIGIASNGSLVGAALGAALGDSSG